MRRPSGRSRLVVITACAFVASACSHTSSLRATRQVEQLALESVFFAGTLDQRTGVARRAEQLDAYIERHLQAHTETLDLVSLELLVRDPLSLKTRMPELREIAEASGRRYAICGAVTAEPIGGLINWISIIVVPFFGGVAIPWYSVRDGTEIHLAMSFRMVDLRTATILGDATKVLSGTHDAEDDPTIPTSSVEELMTRLLGPSWVSGAD